MKLRILAVAILAGAAVAAGAQTYPFTGPQRTFSGWTKSNDLNLTIGVPSSGPGRVFSPWTASNSYDWTYSNGFPAGAQGQSTTVQIGTEVDTAIYVFVGGLVDASITVQGMGSGSSSTVNNDLQVLSNVDLTFDLVNFNAVSFTPDSGTATPGPNSVVVNYDFQAWSNYSTGETIDSTGNATGSELGDATLAVSNSTLTPQSATLGLNLSQTTDGVGTLRIVRSVSLTGLAPGDATYTSVGSVVVTVN